MRIEEVGNKVKRTISNKWVLFGVGGVVLIIMLIKDKGNVEVDEENVKMAYASYPDSVTNADVIISSLQSSIDFAREEMSEDITEQLAYTNELLEEGFEAKDDFITKSIENITNLSNLNHDSIMEGLDNLSNKMGSGFDDLSYQVEHQIAPVAPLYYDGALKQEMADLKETMLKQNEELMKNLQATNSNVQSVLNEASTKNTFVVADKTNLATNPTGYFRRGAS